MIQDIILYILIGLIISAIIFYIFYSQYRKKINLQLEEKHQMEKEIILLKEREKSFQELLTKNEKEYNERLQSQKAEQQQSLTLQREAFAQQVLAMEAQFKSLSEEITKQRADELSKSNKSTMDDIINPLKETIEKMEKSLKDNNEKGAERMGSLKEQINSLMTHTTEIGNKADHLSEALRMKSKIQGNWGETILETLLQSEGLEEYIHYNAQKMLKDEHNRSIYPDFILRLPEDRMVILDSKVSLKAYTDYHSTDDPNEKEMHLKNHINSVKTHISELAQKEYYKYIDKRFSAPDFVIMFIPISGALQLALQQDSSLYQYALKQGIFLSSTQSIMPILWIIKDLWTQVKQEKNLEEIVKHAENLLTRLKNFFNDFENVEKALLQAQKAYEDANRKIRGRQGVLTSALNIQEAGIKLNSKGELPAPLYDEYEDSDPEHSEFSSIDPA